MFAHIYLCFFLFIFIDLCLPTLRIIYPYLVKLSLIVIILPYEPHSPKKGIFRLRLHLCVKFESHRTITHGYLAFKLM